MFSNRVAGPQYDDDESSEATRIDLAKSLAFLRRAAPLPEERAGRPIAPGIPSSAAVKKKLNFDDTENSFCFDPPTLPGLKARLAEAQSENESLKKKLVDQKYTLENLRKGNEDHLATIQNLRREVSHLKRSLSDKEQEMREQDSLNESLSEKVLMDDWRVIANKYYIWYHTAKRQLDVAGQIMARNGLLTKDHRAELLDAQRLTLVTITEDQLPALSSGSVQCYEGMPALCGEGVDEEECNPEDATAQSTMSRQSVCISPICADNDSAALNESSVLNSTLFNTSMDYEKDEKIVRLEVQNDTLLNRLKWTKGKADMALLLEEQKRGLEERVTLLQAKLGQYVAEVEALRAASANQMFHLADSTTQSRAFEMTDRVKKLQMRVTQLEADLAGRAENEEKLREELHMVRREKEDLDERVSCAVSAEQEHQRFVIEKEAELAERDEKFNSISADLIRLQAEVVEMGKREKTLKEELARTELDETVKPPTDAGDTTQIFHMAANPLQTAHDELMEESRKRKLCDQSELDRSGTSKRMRDDQLEQIEMKLMRLEKDKQRAASIHADFTKKYRTIITVLTGYDVKVKDIEEGICHVDSVYDESEKQFIFKYCADTQRVDLLDCGMDSASQGRLWEEEMRRYIGQRQSVPAFLAAVTLSLEERRDLEEKPEDDFEKTHTYSVLHHD